MKTMMDVYAQLGMSRADVVDRFAFPEDVLLRWEQYPSDLPTYVVTMFEELVKFKKDRDELRVQIAMQDPFLKCIPVHRFMQTEYERRGVFYSIPIHLFVVDPKTNISSDMGYLFSYDLTAGKYQDALVVPDSAVEESAPWGTALRLSVYA